MNRPYSIAQAHNAIRLATHSPASKPTTYSSHIPSIGEARGIIEVSSSIQNDDRIRLFITKTLEPIKIVHSLQQSKYIIDAACINNAKPFFERCKTSHLATIPVVDWLLHQGLPDSSAVGNICEFIRRISPIQYIGSTDCACRLINRRTPLCYNDFAAAIICTFDDHIRCLDILTDTYRVSRFNISNIYKLDIDQEQPWLMCVYKNNQTDKERHDSANKWLQARSAGTIRDTDGSEYLLGTNGFDLQYDWCEFTRLSQLCESDKAMSTLGALGDNV